MLENKSIKIGRLFDRLLWACNYKRSIGYSSFLERAFLPDHRQLPWDRRGVEQQKTKRREGPNAEQIRSEGGTKWHLYGILILIYAFHLFFFQCSFTSGSEGGGNCTFWPKIVFRIGW